MITSNSGLNGWHVAVVGIVAIAGLLVSVIVESYAEKVAFADAVKTSSDPIATACALLPQLSGEGVMLCTLRAAK